MLHSGYLNFLASNSRITPLTLREWMNVSRYEMRSLTPSHLLQVSGCLGDCVSVGWLSGIVNWFRAFFVNILYSQWISSWRMQALWNVQGSQSYQSPHPSVTQGSCVWGWGPGEEHHVAAASWACVLCVSPLHQRGREHPVFLILAHTWGRRGRERGEAYKLSAFGHEKMESDSLLQLSPGMWWLNCNMFYLIAFGLIWVIMMPCETYSLRPAREVEVLLNECPDQCGFPEAPQLSGMGEASG